MFIFFRLSSNDYSAAYNYLVEKIQVRYCNLNQLSDNQLAKYKEAIPLAFPEIIIKSQQSAKYWSRLEKYFSESQLYLIDDDDNVVAFMNTIPFYWDQPFSELPERGWDWMLQRGIENFENQITPNTLGGLQVIVPKPYQQKGYSQLMISKAKSLSKKLGYKGLVIPIRPILKHLQPNIKMSEYLRQEQNGQVKDPWIRTHISSGASVIKVCSKAMWVYGNICFWQKLIPSPIKLSGDYIVKGALNPVKINIEEDYGEYFEENIWIHYD